MSDAERHSIDLPTEAVAAIALGANLGDRAAALSSALAMLDAEPGVRVLSVSRTLTTEAVGGPEGQPDYFNACALLATVLAPRVLLDRMLAIEAEHGRDRATERRWGPRTLDLDLLTHGERIIEEPGLSLPHPRLTVRRFVLEPLCEIAPDLVIPGTGRAVREHLERLS